MMVRNNCHWPAPQLFAMVMRRASVVRTAACALMAIGRTASKKTIKTFAAVGGDTRGLVKHHESRARRALIDRPNVVFHGAGPFR